MRSVIERHKSARAGAVLGALLLAATGVGACAGSEAPVTGSELAGMGNYRLAAVRGSSFSATLGDYLAGSHALESGRLEEAADFFQRALGGDPDNVELLDQLFMLSLASGRYDQALELGAQLAEIDPEADEARLLRALEAARGGDFALARERLELVGGGGIAALALPFLDAWAIFGQGNGAAEASASAVVRLEDASPLRPLNEFHTAVLLDLGGDLEEARRTLGDAMPESGRAPSQMAIAYASMLARAGEREEAVRFIGANLADGREHPGLRQALEILVEGGTPELPFARASGGMADALFGIAQALHQERSGARAAVYARLALFLEPGMGDAAILIGDMMTEQENHPAAIVAYGLVPDDSPLAYAAGLRTARALHSLEREDEAYELLEQLAAAGPERTEALIQLGDLLRRTEAYERAQEAYSRAIERLDEVRPEDWTLFYARGITFERTERWSEAEVDFLQALELEPEQPFVLNYLGYSWVDMGMNLEQAEGMLNRAVELRPNDGFIVDSLGWVYYRLGQYAKAVDHLERAVELEPGDPVINDHLGDAYWRVGRVREARFQWQRALSLDPEEDQIEEIEKKLDSGLPDKPKLDHT
jgi:Flp pilus assembly protein TadD